MALKTRICFACEGEGYNLVFITDYDGEVVKEGRTTCVICGGKGEWDGIEVDRQNGGHGDPYARARRMFTVLEGGKAREKGSGGKKKNG